MSLLFLPGAEFFHFLLGRGKPLTLRQKVEEHSGKLKETKKRKGNKLRRVKHDTNG